MGGETIEEERYIAPTIVTDVDWDDSLMEECVLKSGYTVSFSYAIQQGKLCSHSSCAFCS